MFPGISKIYFLFSIYVSNIKHLLHLFQFAFFKVTFQAMKDATSQGIKKTLPTHSDIIVAYSTVPDQVSFSKQNVQFF